MCVQCAHSQLTAIPLAYLPNSTYNPAADLHHPPCHAQVQGAANDLAECSAAAHNKLAMFGARMPALIELIQRNARHFSTLPVGPLGAYLSLSDER